MPCASDKQRCRNCGRWHPAPEDRCCAWCGKPTTSLTVAPPELHFAIGQTQSALHIRNDGVSLLTTALRFDSGIETHRFSISPAQPDNLFEIMGGGHQTVTITFDARALDPAQEYSAVLVIESNAVPPGDTVRVPLVVQRPPKACLLPPPPHKQVIVYGDESTFVVPVRNQGGGILKVLSVLVQEPQAAAGSRSVNADIAAGQDSALRIALDVEKLKAGDHMLRGRIEFANHAELEFTHEITLQRPARLRLVSSPLAVDLYPISRRHRLEVCVENIGDEPLRIERIESSLRWADPLCKNTLVPPKQRTYIDVFINGKELTTGTYPGALEILSNSFGGTVEVPFEVVVHDLEALEDAIGLDFGTALSCVATVREGDPVLVDINPEDDSDTVEGHSLPSVVFFEENFFPLVGVVARKRAALVPTAAVQSVKRLLASRRKLRIRDRLFEPTEVSTEIFRALLSAVERSILPPASPVHAVLTVPADISDEQKTGVLDSAAAAGLDVDHTVKEQFVLDEPSAAALYYLWKRRKQQNVPKEELIFIYDFGAGTLDCSLVQVTRDQGSIRIRVLATTGDRELGGDDIDCAIALQVAADLHKSDAFDDWAVRATRAQLADKARSDETAYRKAVDLRSQFLRQAELLKIQLSKDQSATMKFPLGTGKDKEYRFTRQQFEQLLEPLLNQSDLAVRGCCSLAGVDSAQVNSVLHSGRSSAIQAIRERVNRFFPNAQDQSEFIEAKQCVALGAAWWAHIKNRPGANIHFEGLAPRLPHSIGYVATEGVDTVFKPIFDAGQACPCELVLDFHCEPGRRFRLEIVEKKFGVDPRTRRRGSVLLPASPTAQEYRCTLRLTPNRTLEVVLGNQRLKIDACEDDDISLAEE